MLFGVTLLASAITLSMSSCDKSKTQEPQTPQTEKATPAEGMKIAYVEVDSIMTNYTFCKDYSLILQKKGQNIQNTLEAKQRQLQAAAANFQQRFNKMLTLKSRLNLLELVCKSNKTTCKF